MYQLICVPFISFEDIAKSILFSSILNFAILSVFNMGNVIDYLAVIGGRGGALRSVDSQRKVEKFALYLPPPHNILNLTPSPAKYSKPSYAYA